MGNGHFKIIDWQEKPYIEQGASKITESQVEYEYTGDLVGKSTVRFLMHYLESGITHYVGLEHFTGSYMGKNGSFSMIHRGIDRGKDNSTTAEISVVENSGTDELASLSGNAEIQLHGHSESYPIILAFKL